MTPVAVGAPTSVTLFIGTAPKLASFALAFRLLAHGLGVAPGEWTQMLMVIAVVSLVIGKFLSPRLYVSYAGRNAAPF